jgi:hypothetical protein
MNMRRRQFVTLSAATGLGTAFDALVARKARAAAGAGSGAGGYGRLRIALPFPSPALEALAPSYDAVPPILMLPPGFFFSVVSVQGMPMDDRNAAGVRYPTPPAMDGMTAVSLPNGNVRLIRNHEDRVGPFELGLAPGSAAIAPWPDFVANQRGPRAAAYDDICGGGTTSLEVEPHGARRLVGSHWSLAGTVGNCSGGVTPWGTWISCEEASLPVSTKDRSYADVPTGYKKRHGYCFEVPANTTAGSPTAPIPLTGLGRFTHEAVAVDPRTGIIYLTEDNSSGDAGFYRWVPPVGRTPKAFGDLAALHASGTLQMLKVKGEKNTPLWGAIPQGKSYAAEWVTIDTPDPAFEAIPHRDDRTTPFPAHALPTVNQGKLKGAAIFKKLEGAFLGNGKVYFAASHTGTTGTGSTGLGQIWEYEAGAVDPAAPAASEGTLRLLYDATDVAKLDGPDNVCVTPRGGLLLCEDGGGTQFLRGLTPDGTIFDFARNVYSQSEFAGACFSPDGQTLFVNIISDWNLAGLSRGPYATPGTRVVTGGDQGQLAMTLAIFGTWGRGRL